MEELKAIVKLSEHVDSTTLMPIASAVLRPYYSQWQTVAFTEAIEYLEFAAKSKSGQPRNCKKGYACGNGCISRTKTCRKKHTPKAKTAQQWLKNSIPPSSSASTTAVNTNSEGRQLSDAFKNKDYEKVLELSDSIYKRAKTQASSDNDFYIGMTAGNGGEDFILKTLYSDFGFDGNPSVVSRTDFSADLNDSNQQILFRAVGSSRSRFNTHFNNFKQGDYFAGSGIYGHGTYVAGIEGGRSKRGIDDTATNIASYGSGTMAMSIPRARIISDNQLQSELRAAYQDFSSWRRQERSRLQSSNASIQELSDFKKRTRRAEAVLFGDQGNGISGRFAVLQGYDAVSIGNVSYDPSYIVLHNRSAVRVQEDPWR